MAITLDENLLPQVDGSTDTFTVVKPYVPGTLMLGYNGQLYSAGRNIKAELTETTFQLEFVPATDTHDLHVIYTQKGEAESVYDMQASGRPPGSCGRM